MFRFLILTFWFLVVSLAAAGQSSCLVPAGEIVEKTFPPECYPISDSSDTLELCFTFTAPGSLLLFTSVPPANCDNYQISAQLYDSSCSLINPNAFGIISTTPGSRYVWCATYICTGSIGYGPTFCPSFADYSPLPVSWLYFYGRYLRQEGAVRLSWATASEINSDRFEIEQSYDGVNYKFIGGVDAAGNATSVRYYSADDQYPGRVNYYRIRQIDFDGASSVSNTIFIAREDGSGNSVEEFVFDAYGRVLPKGTRVEDLAPGLYIVHINGKWIRKIWTGN